MTGQKPLFVCGNYPYQEYFNRLLSRLRRVVFVKDAESVINRNLVPGYSKLVTGSDKSFPISH